ncbi:MAG: HEAT repeat domain-containing protein [Fimbriimonadales bacterium]|nr:HEAT repeat domain-containing protein [Fimbriimonadales bacterium]MDW8052165.1 HEAT repeat domain-containing protein [Armatimonadota bacterium]
MARWLARVLFVAVVGGIIGSAIWNNIATNRLIEQATGTDRAAQVAALSKLAQRDDFFDLLQSRKLPARMRVAEGVEAMNNADGVKIALEMLRDPDPRVRERFLTALRRIGKANLAAVAEGLKNSNAQVRNGTVQVMIALGAESVPHALKVFEESSERAGATEVLAHFGAQSVPGLLELLRTKQDEGLRLDAIAALGRIGDRRATEAILPFLSLPSEKRRVVLAALGSIADPRTESILVRALRSSEEDSDARAQVALGLGKLGTPRALRALQEALSELNLTVADAAALGLQRAGVRALPYLAEAARHPDPAVRQRVASALGGIADAQAVRLLANMLRDPDVRVARAAATALGTAKHPAAVPELVRALSHPDGGVVQNAAHSLAQIGAPAINALIAALRASDPATAYWAADALSRIPAAEPALLQAARDPATQRYALIALIKRDSPAALPLLQQAARSQDPTLRELARRGLQQLAP